MLDENHSSIVKRAKQLSVKMSQWRRTVHAHPELSFQEIETARLVASVLEELPEMKIQRGIAKTGVLGTLTSGNGPTMLIRADMDALPIQEKNDHSFVSQNEGIMHACGHDAHTSILLGVASLLADEFQHGRLQGTVRFLFQPAEEDVDPFGLTGGAYVVQERVLDDVDAAIALHVSPSHPVGNVQIHSGYSMANVDIFTGEIEGVGGHAAYPHLTNDPIWALGIVMQALYGIVSRKVSPLEAAVLSVTRIETGATNNVIPQQVLLGGTLRSYTPSIRELLIEEVEKSFRSVKGLGYEYQLEIHRGEPALYNDAAIGNWFTQTVQDLYPTFSIIDGPFGLAGEDFSHIAQKIPAAMFFLGCSQSDSIARDLHTPIFDLDEACLPIGASILAETAIRFLQGDYRL